MSEFSSFIHTEENPKYTTPSWESLTPEQQEKILAGPDWVYHPAQMVDFDDLEEFRTHEGDYTHYGSNNFKCYFIRAELYDQNYRTQPYFQRYKIIYEEQAEHIETRMAELNGWPDDELWAELLDAYKKMRVLVDYRDRYVATVNGVDSYFLTR